MASNIAINISGTRRSIVSKKIDIILAILDLNLSSRSKDILTSIILNYEDNIPLDSKWRKEMSKDLGLSLNTFNMALSKMRKLGVIKGRGGSITPAVVFTRSVKKIDIIFEYE